MLCSICLMNMFIFFSSRAYVSHFQISQTKRPEFSLNKKEHEACINLLLNTDLCSYIFQTSIYMYKSDTPFEETTE